MFLLRVLLALAASRTICAQVFASDVKDLVFTIHNAGTAVFSHAKHLNAPAINEMFRFFVPIYT
jgi:hypothetical protein